MSKVRGGSLIFLAAGIYGLIFSIQLPLGQWNQPGPAVFPLSLSVLLCVSGILWFVQGKGREAKTASLRGVIQKFTTPIRIVGLTVAFILTFVHLGYLLTSTIYLFVLFFWVSRYKLWTALVLAIILGAGSSFFFEKLLATPLPRGFLSL